MHPIYDLLAELDIKNLKIKSKSAHACRLAISISFVLPSKIDKEKDQASFHLPHQFVKKKRSGDPSKLDV